MVEVGGRNFLTADEVRDLRRKYRDDDEATVVSLAKEYDISAGAVSMFVNGERRHEAGGPIKGEDYGTN